MHARQEQQQQLLAQKSQTGTEPCQRDDKIRFDLSPLLPSLLGHAEDHQILRHQTGAAAVAPP